MCDSIQEGLAERGAEKEAAAVAKRGEVKKKAQQIKKNNQ